MKVRVVAKVLLSNDQGQVLLLKRSASDIRRPLEWDIPGGHVEQNEHPDDAACRETSEETGIEIATNQLRLAYAMSEKVADDLVVSWLFYVAQTSQTEVILSPDEHCEYTWVPLDEAIGMLEYERQKRALSFIGDNGLRSAEYD